MSFHEDSFHETKRERKFYEDRKQKALRYIDHTIDDTIPLLRSGLLTSQKLGHKLKELRKRVNDI